MSTIDQHAPKLAGPSTGSVDPRRPKLREAMELCSCTISKNEAMLPAQLAIETNIALLTREKLRKEKLLPRQSISSAAIDDPRRTTPLIKSRTPNLHKLRMVSALPSFAHVIAEAELPTRPKPSKEGPDPSRVKLRDERELPR